MNDGTAPTWRALADPTRRGILDLLRRGPRITGEVCDEFQISRFAVMKHLRVLEAANLVTVRKEGRECWNYLNATPLQSIYERWISPYSALWSNNLSRLKSQVEEKEVESMKNMPKFISIAQDVKIDAPASKVFDALTENIAAWWGVPYYIGDKPKDLILEPKVGGRFYEVWSSTEGSLWGVVSEIRKNERLEISGSIGMSGAVHGKLGFDLQTKGKSTMLKMTHSAVGDVDEESRKNFSVGWKDLLGIRLKAFCEKGKKYGLGHEPPANVPTFD